MRVLHLVDNAYVVQFDVQKLIHALQRSLDGDVVLQLNGDLMVDEGFEEASG